MKIFGRRLFSAPSSAAVSIGEMEMEVLDDVTKALAKGINSDDAILRDMSFDLTTFDDVVDRMEVYNVSTPAMRAYAHAYCKILPKEKVLFQALFRKAFINSRSNPAHNHQAINPPVLSAPQTLDYYAIKSNVRPKSTLEESRLLLSKVVVVKFVSCSESSAVDEILPLIQQIKVLNRQFSCNVPLFLVSVFFNNLMVSKIARTYSDKDLTIHELKQPVFPFTDEAPSVTPSKTVCDLLGIQQQTTGYNRRIKLSKGRLEIASDHLTSLPYERQLDAWYLPGDGYALCKLVASDERAKAKEYVLVWNTSEFENLLDINILSYLSGLSESGEPIDICLEVAAARENSNMDISSEYLIRSGERPTVLDTASLESLHYYVDETDIIFTKNMWIRMLFLTSGSMVQRLEDVTRLKKMQLGGHQAMKLAMSVAYLSEQQDTNTLAIKVPFRRMGKGGTLGWLWKLLNPPWTVRLRIRMVLTYFVAYLLYHGTVYWLMALLHGVFIPKHEKSISENKCTVSEEGDLSLFWTENAIWLLTLGIYMSFLTRQRLKMAGWSRRPQDREAQAKVDAYQGALLATTRFLYSGLKKTAEVRGWLGGNVWAYLAMLHGCAFVVEFFGSCLILWYHGELPVLEPMEPS